MKIEYYVCPGVLQGGRSSFVLEDILVCLSCCAPDTRDNVGLSDQKG